MANFKHKFRRKPVIVEAEQWFPGVSIEGVFYEEICGMKFKEPSISTPQGLMSIKSGDWIVTETDGKKYPWKPHEFDERYERID